MSVGHCPLTIPVDITIVVTYQLVKSFFENEKKVDLIGSWSLTQVNCPLVFGMDYLNLRTFRLTLVDNAPTLNAVYILYLLLLGHFAIENISIEKCVKESQVKCSIIEYNM